MGGKADYSEGVARPRNESGTLLTMGIPYEAPTRGAGVSEATPLSRGGLAWRIVASIVLAGVGVNAVVTMVLLFGQPDSAWVGALGMAAVAMLMLAYPVVNIVRWIRAGRRGARA